jgi:hypothetical protein
MPRHHLEGKYGSLTLDVKGLIRSPSKIFINLENDDFRSNGFLTFLSLISDPEVSHNLGLKGK